MLQKWFDQMSEIFDLQRTNRNPYGCGQYVTGSGKYALGFSWIYHYQNLFSIVKTDLVLEQDLQFCIKEYLHYFSLRLDDAKYMPPGKILAFLEEQDVSIDRPLKKGTRIAYTEVIYSAEFCMKHFNSTFSDSSFQPIEILRGLSAENNWSMEINQSLQNIHHCELTGSAAELFYIGEACKLLSALIETGSKRLPGKNEDFEDIQRVLQYIDRNYHGNIRQQDLVKLVHMSPTKLKTLFRKFTNRSISDYILEKKIEGAIRMLSDTDLPIQEIAAKLGFRTPSGFAASFKKRVGQSPGSYRNDLKIAVMNRESYFEELAGMPRP